MRSHLYPAARCGVTSIPDLSERKARIIIYDLFPRLSNERRRSLELFNIKYSKMPSRFLKNSTKSRGVDTAIAAKGTYITRTNSEFADDGPLHDKEGKL